MTKLWNGIENNDGLFIKKLLEFVNNLSGSPSKLPQKGEYTVKTPRLKWLAWMPIFKN